MRPETPSGIDALDPPAPRRRSSALVLSGLAADQAPALLDPEGRSISLARSSSSCLRSSAHSLDTTDPRPIGPRRPRGPRPRNHRGRDVAAGGPGTGPAASAPCRWRARPACEGPGCRARTARVRRARPLQRPRRCGSRCAPPPGIPGARQTLPGALEQPAGRLRSETVERIQRLFGSPVSTQVFSSHQRQGRSLPEK